MAFSSTSASHYFSFLFVMFCISATFLSSRISGSDINGGAVPQVEKITKALSDAGYEAMSLTLQLTLPTLLNSHFHSFRNSSGGLTIFCPPDQAFFSLKYYPQPPLTLLQYHVVPVKLEKETLLESSSSLLHPIGSKIDTLLQGHPLVVTDSGRKASINEVEIKKWDVYNDGAVVVHGVHEFFNPSYQTIMYPWYDHTNNSSTDGKRYSSSNDKEIGGNDGSLFEDLLLGAGATIVALIMLLFCLVCCGVCSSTYEIDYDYV